MKFLTHPFTVNSRILIASVIAVITLSIMLLWFMFRVLNQSLPSIDQSSITISPGSSLTQVSNEMHSQGLLPYPLLFKLLAQIKGVESSIQSGEYELNEGITASQLLTKMVTGDTIQYRVTLVEGWTFQEALKAIQNSEKINPELGGLSVVEIVDKVGLPYSEPEGALFPDTYFYTAGSSDLEILQRASAKLEQVLNQEWSTKLGALPYENPYQALIMASIIEKESAASSERGHIAGVFVRRLERGMRLQSDPTVIYGLGDSYDGDIKRSDLLETTPYNTYRINGLPPTPIALAGRESIHASLNPEQSDYLYFVSQGDGSHYFSSNLEEHNAAVRRLLSLDSPEP